MSEAEKAFDDFMSSFSDKVDDPEFVWITAYETGFGEGLLEGFESGKQEGRDRAAEIILAGAQHYDDVTRGILTRFAKAIRQQGESAGDDIDRLIKLAEKVTQQRDDADEQPCSPGQHRWKSQRQGGDPSEIGSYEWVTYCKVCGAEYDGESAGDGI